MKTYFIILPVFFAHSVFAADSLLWSCSQGAEANAVTVSANTQPGEFDLILRIDDSRICDTLNLQCPYQTPAKNSYLGVIGIVGEYATGVVLVPDNGGMKLSIAQINQTTSQLDTYQNWYFNPGECQQNVTTQ
jgi:hypothetical protein